MRALPNRLWGLWLHVIALLFMMLPGAQSALADRLDEIIRIHVEAIGGRERINALHGMRASGTVTSAGKRMRFTMIAARPDKIRVETQTGGRTLVQACDGVNPPWEFDTGDWPPRYRDMAAPVAKTFAADAEFDDPIVGGAARGFTFDYAGEMEADGKKTLRILVTRNLTETFSLLLDPETFLIIRRVEQKNSPVGGTVQVVTVFDDYRPVEGVLIPHHIALVVGNQVKQQTTIETIQPNPEITDETFTRPRKITLPGR